MILAIDIGNTNIVLGLFDGDTLTDQSRISTETKKTADEYGILISSILKLRAEMRVRVKGIIISSVVPPLTGIFAEMTRKYFNLEPVTVGPGLKTGLSIEYDDPRQVGADRVVNAVAAERLYGTPCIIVDFGTAVTFCAVDEKKRYLGGAIFPGIKTAYDALAEKAARLPRIGLGKPDKAIGRTTESSMISGAIYGYAGMVDAIVRRFADELGGKARVIATGGMIEYIAPYSETIEIVDRDLTLKGLLMLYTMNQAYIMEMSGMNAEKSPPG
jgi:type III pantothenate kinase